MMIEHYSHSWDDGGGGGVEVGLANDLGWGAGRM